jgi:putative nucleotidyltransferase with HDIG domain
MQMQTITRQVRVFVPVVVGLAAIVVVALAGQITWGEWPRLLLLFCVMAVAFSVRVPRPRGGAVTPSSILSYLAIYVLSPPTGVLVVGAARTLGYVVARGWVPWRALFNGCQVALSVAAGSTAFALLGGEPGHIRLESSYLALIAGPLAHQVANNFFVAYGSSRWRGTPFLSTWLQGVRDLLWSNLLSIPTAILLAVLYVNLHYTTLVAYLALLPLQWQALRLYIKRRQLYAQIVDGLVVATDANFPLARGHARRVSDLAVAIAREMRLSETAVESVQFSALLHDVGMIGKDDVLDRPVLTPEDTESLLEHVRVGAEIARELPRKDIANAILHHHEAYDGSGYPEGLSGEAIPLTARIVAVAEAADSMASGIFPYTTVLPASAIASHISAGRGKAFDPDVVDGFLRVVEQEAR